MHSRGYQKGQFPLVEPAPTFETRTMLVPHTDGIQVVAVIAPQVNIVVNISLEQVQDVLTNVMRLRVQKNEPTTD